MPVCRSSTPLTSVAAVGVSVTSVPLQEWSHDLETTAAVDADKGFIRNSHDPSGTVVTSEALGSFLERCRARLVVGALRTVRREVRCDHERLRDAFVAAGFGVVPSQANFVLVLAAAADLATEDKPQTSEAEPASGSLPLAPIQHLFLVRRPGP